VLGIAIAAGACGSTSSSTVDSSGTTTVTSDRPASDATIEIVTPGDGAEVAGSVRVEVRITNGRIVGPVDRAPTRGDVGHVHLLLDGGIETQMLYGSTADLGRLEPGTHTLQAEFVATDHLPFANRPSTTIVFRVR
jgi:hypothetical protein